MVTRIRLYIIWSFFIHFAQPKVTLFVFFFFFFQNLLKGLTLSWRRPMSYRNQSIDLLRNSMDWFLDDIGLPHERVKKNNKPVSEVIVSMIAFSQHTTLDNQHDQTCFDKNVLTERMPLERVSSAIRLLRLLLDWKNAISTGIKILQDNCSVSVKFV